MDNAMSPFEQEQEMMMLFLLLFSVGMYQQYVAGQRRVRSPRRYNIRPLNRPRRRLGHYNNLVTFMKEHDEEQFFKYTRMTPAQYDRLLLLLEPRLKRRKSIYTLSPGQQLIMTLHYLSEGCSMQQIAWDYYIGKTTVHKIIKNTCTVLWNVLVPLYMPSLTKEELEKVMDGFYKRWNIPNCFGAVDGKHVSIQAPQHSGTEYFSYKKSFSLLLMATCDAFYKFTYVDIGAPGSQNDSTTFKETAFGQGILKETWPIPDARPLPGTAQHFPCYLVADQAFPLSKHIMRPYPGDNLPDSKRIFNYRLSRARRCIENTFAILVQRWRCLRKPIIGNIDTCEQIVQACVILHNYVQKSEEDIPISLRKYCPTGFADYVDVDGHFHYGEWRNTTNMLQGIGRVGSNHPSRTIAAQRDELKSYFSSEYGSVPWQNDTILEGAVPREFINNFL